ncbi:MAG: lipoyl(octanoyl) transferase LipB, partial [Spirochaetota bacterium]|nr:lipoyl(octanoyl) transferase LipB [Spirochaetota bacterium]
PDTLLLLEHRPVITLGKRGEESDLLIPREELADRGVEIAHIDRGGQATYHGPGQLVGYPIIDLQNHERRLKRFVHNLEAVIIEVLADSYGIAAHAREDYVGVWVGSRKIAAIGISVHRKITMHGFALNVDTDLDYFSLIVPCGIRSSELGITSISKELGEKITVAEVKERIAPVFSRIYGYGRANKLQAPGSPQVPDGQPAPEYTSRPVPLEEDQ